MLSSGNPEFSQTSLKIKQDDKFFTRLLSKESSAANPSFRVYYGNVSSGVPFTWEIQPGTPKHKFSDNSIPPLTPPPSYFISNHDRDHNKPTKRKYCHRSKLLYNLLLNIKLIKEGHVASSSPSSLSSSSWSSSMSSTVPSKGYSSRRRRFTSFGSSFDDGHMYASGSPDPMKSFGMNSNNSRDSNGCASAYTVVILKKAFFSIVGCRSG